MPKTRSLSFTIRIILSVTLMLGHTIAFGLSNAVSSDCPSTWSVSLNPPSKTQEILKSLNANPYWWEPNYPEAFDSTGVLKTKLSQYKKNDYSVKLIAQASPNGEAFTDYLPQTYFSYLGITGYKYRYALEIATVDCPSKHTFFSQSDVIAPQNYLTSSFAEALSDAPFEFKSRTIDRFLKCKAHLISQASSGKDLELNFPYKDVWAVPDDATKAEGCAGLLKENIGWASSTGKQILWEKVVFAPISGDLCLTMDSRSLKIKTTGACKVGVFTFTFYHDAPTLLSAKPRLLDSFVLPEPIIEKPKPAISPVPTPSSTPTPTSSDIPTTFPTPVKSLKTTITCVKGKLIKKVTAVKPKCPAGYKVKK